jgi:hypothetical protein
MTEYVHSSSLVVEKQPALQSQRESEHPCKTLITRSSLYPLMYPVSHARRIVLFLALLALVATAAASTNYIQIFTHPGSGTVCLDSQCQVNQGTISGYSSTRFEGVTGGQDHTIRVYNTEGYEDYSEKIYMDYAGDTITWRIYLEPLPTRTPAPGTGAIQVFVSPGLGQVCLDNRECESSIGEPSTFWSVQFSDVPADSTHTITVTADGYQTYTQQVTIQPDQISDLDITLQQLPVAASAGSPQTPPAAAPPIATRAAPDVSLPLFAAGIVSALFLIRKQGN